MQAFAVLVAADSTAAEMNVAVAWDNKGSSGA